MSTQDEIEALFDTYLAAWNARDFDGMAALFAEPVTYFLPDGPVVVPDRAAVAQGLKTQFARLELDGFSHTEIESVSARACNDSTAIVDLTNVARLRADGSAIDVLDAVYTCTKQAGRWCLSAAIPCRPGWKTH